MKFTKDISVQDVDNLTLEEKAIYLCICELQRIQDREILEQLYLIISLFHKISKKIDN